ncbi:MAG: hypothetical protein O2973_08710 [Gemmatimonadetes bacterium]|nr:hypothetical protein [Gemmatimonadota bacterium]
MISEPSDLHLTERVRKAVELANDEAARHRHEYVGTAHLLMALVDSGEGVAAAVLKDHGVPPQELRKRLDVVIQHGRYPDDVNLERAMTTKCRRTFAYAEQEARTLGHNYIGSEHLLIGFLNEPASVAGQILIEAGITEEVARQDVLRLLGSAAKHTGADPA